MTVDIREGQAVVIYPLITIKENDEFNITFQYLDKDEYIRAYLRKSDGSTQDLVLDTDYEVINFDGTGNVWGKLRVKKSFGADNNQLRNICIYRSVDNDQSRTFDSQTMFADTTEEALDKLTILYQDNQFKEYTIHAPDDDKLDKGAMRLPSAEERANKYLFFDTNGNAVAGEAGAQTKSLRQPMGEDADPSFELGFADRVNQILGFNELGSVRWHDSEKLGKQSDWDQPDNTKIDFIKNKPTIPAAQVNSDWNATAGVERILNKPDLATVATSGSYNDLKDKLVAGRNIEINSSNSVSAILPVATESNLGCIKVGDGLSINHPAASDPQTLNARTFIFQEGWYTLPRKELRGNKLIAFDENGSPTYPPLWDYDNFRNIRVSKSESTGALNLELPSPEERKGMIIGFNENNGKQISMVEPYKLPTAGGEVLGGVKVDNSTIRINEDGVISVDGFAIYEEGQGIKITTSGHAGPIIMALNATDKVAGMVQPDNNTIRINNYGVISATYTAGENIAINPADQNKISCLIDYNVIDVQLLVDDWISESGIYTQEKSINYIKSSDRPIIDVKLSDDISRAKIELSEWPKVGRVTTADGKIKVYCYYDKPSTSLNVQMQVTRNNNGYGELRWQPSSMPHLLSWRSVTYGSVNGNGRFVAVTENGGKVAYSDDGVTWIGATMPSSSYWRSVTYGVVNGNGRFVAIANGSKQAAYSDDGVTWIASTLPYSTNWESITYGIINFVAVGTNVSIYSDDGINWGDCVMESPEGWISVTHGNDRFVAISFAGDKVRYSFNGITWMNAETPIPSAEHWTSVTYGNGKFVAVGVCNTAYSDDGITWIVSTIRNLDRSSVAYGGGTFVSISNGANIIEYSVDGINWKELVFDFGGYWQSITYGNGRFVIVGDGDKSMYTI